MRMETLSLNWQAWALLANGGFTSALGLTATTIQTAHLDMSIIRP